MKRAREQLGHADELEVGGHAFTSSLSNDAERYMLRVRLPTEVVEHSSVLRDLSQLEGSATLEQEPERLFAWLALLAHQHRGAPGADGRSADSWDTDVDAINVRHFVAPCAARVLSGIVSDTVACTSLRVRAACRT